MITNCTTNWVVLFRCNLNFARKNFLEFFKIRFWHENFIISSLHLEENLTFKNFFPTVSFHKSKTCNSKWSFISITKDIRQLKMHFHHFVPQNFHIILQYFAQKLLVMWNSFYKRRCNFYIFIIRFDQHKLSFYEIFPKIKVLTDSSTYW